MTVTLYTESIGEALFLAVPGGSSAQDCERTIQSDQDDSDLASTWSFADFGFVYLLPATWQTNCDWWKAGGGWLPCADVGFPSAVVTV